MVSPDNKKEKFTILEEIYNEDTSKKTTRQATKEYFRNPKKVQKLLSGVIIFVGLAGVMLGFFQLKHNILYGFSPSNDKKMAQKPEYDPEDLLGLKEKDTDQDGLTDFDELNIHKTSPYLPDTDSDGIDDKAEIIANSDPNCPVGKNCTGVASSISDSGADANVATSDDISALLLSGQVQASQLRQLLLDEGVTAEELEFVTDKELLDAYYESVNQQPNDTTAVTDNAIDWSQVDSSASISDPTTIDQIKNLNPNQIRELLAGNGVPQNILNSVSDQELMNLVNETLSTY